MLYILFFCVFIGSAQAEEALFNKALTHLQENQPEEAIHLFSDFLKTEPKSEIGRFNLALSFYKQSGNKDPARAYWRQMLFENPYNPQVKAALNALKDKKYFWLWWPSDLILFLMVLSWVILIFLLFKKKSAAIMWLPVWIVAHSFSAWYFYHRLGNYSSLMADSRVLSAPDDKASVLFRQEAGALVKVLGKAGDSQEWSHIQVSFAKSGWLSSDRLLPLKLKAMPKKKTK